MILDVNSDPIRAAVDDGVLAGALTMVWQDGRLLQVNEIGHRDVAAGQPMRRDTLFRIASMTKPITVAAAMTFVDEGLLALDDEISRWLPEFARPQALAEPGGPPTDTALPDTAPTNTVAARRPLTVDDLITHRGGIGYWFTVPAPLRAAYSRVASMDSDQDEWLARLAALPLAHQPGERPTYGHGTDVLGILLSRLAGMPLSDVLAQRVLDPLGMSDTGFRVTPDGRRRAATMYQLIDGGDGSGEGGGKGSGRGFVLRDDVREPARLDLPPMCAGGAGLWSTADDYLRFARMLLDDGTLDGTRVLSAESARLMRTDRLTDAQRRQPFLGTTFWAGRGFGLNLSVVTDPERAGRFYGPGGPGSFGWPGAWGTWWQADPEHRLILLYLVQNQPDPDDVAAGARGGAALRMRSARPDFVKRTYAALAR